MSITLPPMPYAFDALEPAISADALRYHYEHHHAGYVDAVNRLTRGRELDLASIEQIIARATGPLANAAAQAWNHTFFWESMAPARTQPDAALLEAIENSFGSRASLARRFKLEGRQLFGSGWIWLAADAAGALEVLATPNAGLRLHEGDLAPLLVCDVWEHAYYIDYRGARDAWLDAFWSVVDWRAANRRFQSRAARPRSADRFGAALLDREPARAGSRAWHPGLAGRTQPE
jgi:Fe-Mn family superoxide dismutase